MLDLIADLQNKTCVDPNRIYAAGKSNGGGFVGALACNSTLSSKIAAFAPVSGAFYENKTEPTPLDGPCQPNRSSIPILEFHGQNDTIIPYDGKDCPRRCRHEPCHCPLPSIPSWLEEWALLNQCPGGTPGNESFSVDDYITVNKTTWTCGGNEDIVTGYWIQDLGHVWPSTAPNDDNHGNVTVLNASNIIIDFFKNHTLPTLNSDS